PCYCGADGLHHQRGSPVCPASETRSAGATAVSDCGRARGGLAGRGGEDWWHGSSDAAGLGDPVTSRVRTVSSTFLRTECLHTNMVRFVSMTTVVRCTRTGRACSEPTCQERQWCRQMLERGLSRTGLPLKRKFRPRCGAKTRAGAPC